MSANLAFPELLRITGADASPDQRLVAMRGFAERFHWTPSYEIQGSFGIGSVASHLVVEHGLDNAATISFVRAPFRARDLDHAQMRALLAISYNNLIDWHMFVSDSDVRSVFNLANVQAPLADAMADRTDTLVAGDAYDYLSASALRRRRSEVASGRTLRACDDALIQVVGRWKALLAADYPSAANQNVSALFNAMIFVRGCEDRHLDRQPGAERLLLSTLSGSVGATVDLGDLLVDALAATGVDGSLSSFVAIEALEPFRRVDRHTAANLFRDMYAPREAPYEFNFSLMSKHALSRIYERYVALFKPAADPEGVGDRQLSLIARTPREVTTGRSGAVYTPQFIAGFFARYIRENVTPRRLRELRSIDPACGSGIFLRTLLELQCDPAIAGVTPAAIGQALRSAEGIDRDPNACEATRLSLALLHLVATGGLPASSDLKVRNEDAISEALLGRLSPGTYGAVIVNPPYVKHEHLTDDERAIYARYLGIGEHGRLDAYLPFAKLCVELAEPGGFVCLVLPQSFLTASNGAVIRRRISEQCDVRCVVDLAAVPVFEGVGAYAILLVLQRRVPGHGAGAPAQVARVTESVGAALQACLDGDEADTPAYSVYRVGQGFFQAREWVLVSPARLRFDDRLRTLPRLSDFMDVTQGFVSGADDVFIVPKASIPRGEERIFADFLPDRQILRYRLPDAVERAVLLPVDGDQPLTERQMREGFPQTWDYLLGHRVKLEARGSVRRGKLLWWRPERSRPDTLLRPKIVCPHLMLTSRFAVDVAGSFAVSRAPFVLARDAGEEEALLRLFCAVLNSSVCNWHLRAYSSKYSRGYNRLEVPTLRAVPVPDVRKIDPGTLARITGAVGRLSIGQGGERLDEETDLLVAELYGFTADERRDLLGMA